MPNRAKVARFMRIAAAAASAIASAKCFAVSHSKCKSMKLEQHHVSTRHFGQSSSHVESCVICFQGPFPRQMICHQYLILLQKLRRIEPVATAWPLRWQNSVSPRLEVTGADSKFEADWLRCLECSYILGDFCTALSVAKPYSRLVKWCTALWGASPLCRCKG